MLVAVPTVAAPPRPLDDFEDVSEWQSHPSENVELNISTDTGRIGKAMRLDFDFRGGSGYGIARLPLALDLPENYEFSFWIRGDAPVETLEFKLLDPSMENVWWTRRARMRFPDEWTRMRIKKRHLGFAWGPQGGGEIKRAAGLEIVITAADGGKGTVWIDELTFTPLEAERPYDLTPKTLWSNGTYEMDFLRSRELGGLVIDWGDSAPKDYEIALSDDGKEWATVWRARGSDGGRDYVRIPEGEGRYLRIVSQGSQAPRGVDVQPPQAGETKNNFYDAIAERERRGLYPRYLLGEQSYWTVFGAPGDEHEALINEEGAIDLDPVRFSLEPFIYVETAGKDKLLTWADARSTTQSLENGELPIPTVVRDHGDLRLTITGWDRGEPGHSVLWARYRLQNRSSVPMTVRFHLAIRPLQVNPSWQFLAIVGGAAEVESIRRDGQQIIVNNLTTIVPITRLDSFGAARADQGDPVLGLGNGKTPEAQSVQDPSGSASGIMTWRLDLARGTTRDIVVAIPFHQRPASLDGALSLAEAGKLAEEELAVSRAAWIGRLGRVDLRVPGRDERIRRAVRSQLAYIMINQDGPSIEPGARSYDRSWIRDGSLTSAALLRLAHAEEVERFIEWYARHLRDDGYVPCCVDSRGADPVPEHDSHGQFLYLVHEHWEFTGNRKFLERMWPYVERTVNYIDRLRQERMTPEYQTPEKRAYYGLVPQSISHEGYSAKPMHSYWDDTFILRGLKDAVSIAAALGRTAGQTRFAKVRDEFERDFHNSIALAMRNHRIDYIPGSVELGDFDATSTTTMVNPGNDVAALREPLRQTFERYWQEFTARRDGRKVWENYTPYEWRVVGTYIRLGQRDRAHQATDFFFSHSRPQGWNHWAEVVWNDPKAPKFIGDMPHTWVGSDFIRSMLDFFAYERESDQSLVIGAGVLPGWLRDGAGVEALRTPYGVLSYNMKSEGGAVRVIIDDGLTVPPGGIVVVNPNDGRETVVKTLPADVKL